MGKKLMSKERLREEFLKDIQKENAVPSISFVLPSEIKEKLFR